MKNTQRIAEAWWGRSLDTKRLLGANCDVYFDFDWQAAIGHAYPKFRGLQDLSLAIERRASELRLTPVLLLTDDPARAPLEQHFSADHYVAAVRIDQYLKSVDGHDRSAVFFLQQLADHTASERVAKALIAIQDAKVEEVEGALKRIVGQGGTALLEALLRATENGLQQQLNARDVSTLITGFASNSANLLAQVADASRKRQAVDKLAHLLDLDEHEQKFQIWFQDNPWVLGTSCVRILDERRIDVKNIADYLVESLDGFADVVEIKRPSLSFWSHEKDHGNYVPHQDLTKAITQAQNYQLELEREMDSVKTRSRLDGVPIARPSSLLIHGRSQEWGEEKFVAQRILNSGLSNVTILTYDQVLKRAKALTGESVSRLGT